MTVPRHRRVAAAANAAIAQGAPTAQAQPPHRRPATGQLTLRAYVEDRYRPLMEGFAASTRDTYEREFRLRVLLHLGELPLSQIDRPAVQRMVDACETLSVARKAVSVLRTVLEEALSDELVAANAAKLRYRYPPVGRKRDNGLVIGSFPEMRPVFDALGSYADDGTVSKLAATGLLLGLRPQERYGLEWADFDFRAGTVRIQRAYLQVSRAEGVHDLKAPKSSSGRRTVPLPRAAVSLIRPLREGRERGVFLKGPDGGRLSPSTGRQRWNAFLRWCDAEGLGVPHVTLENMRHSFATSFLAAGGNIENLSRILGHANINTTLQRYVRPDLAGLAADMRRVSM